MRSLCQRHSPTQWSPLISKLDYCTVRKVTLFGLCVSVCWNMTRTWATLHIRACCGFRVFIITHIPAKSRGGIRTRAPSCNGTISTRDWTLLPCLPARPITINCSWITVMLDLVISRFKTFKWRMIKYLYCRTCLLILT